MIIEDPWEVGFEADTLGRATGAVKLVNHD